MSDEFRQGYKTLSERAAERRELAQANLASLSAETSAGEARLNIWRVERQHDETKFCYVRCPSRSGAKIFVNRELGWVGPFWTDNVNESSLPTGTEILTAWFPTVAQEAAEYQMSRK